MLMSLIFIVSIYAVCRLAQEPMMAYINAEDGEENKMVKRLLMGTMLLFSIGGACVIILLAVMAEVSASKASQSIDSIK